MVRSLWKLVLLVPLAFAQSVLKTYYATDLERTPGLLQLSPGFTTVVDFWDVVDSVASGKGELLRIEVSGPRLLLSAQQKAGKTDLVVEAGGRTLLFVVDIAPGTTPRRYKVELSRPPRTGWTRGKELPVAPSSSFPGGPQKGNASLPSKPTQGEGVAPSPEGEDRVASPQGEHREEIQFITTAQVPSDASGSITVFYTLENRSGRSVAIDPSRLVVVQGGERLPYTLKREPLRSVLGPGEAQSGLLVIKGARPGEVQLVWTLVEIGTGREIPLSRSVTPGTRIELQAP